MGHDRTSKPEHAQSSRDAALKWLKASDEASGLPPIDVVVQYER